MASLTDIAYLKNVVSRFPNRHLSQNFLISAPVVSAIVTEALKGPHTVTELGSGPGAVTIPLLEAGFTVKALEKDPAVTTVLQDHVPADAKNRLTVITGDLRDTPWQQPVPYQIVGNIPYHLTGQIIRTITQLEPAPWQAILMVQQEVGKRLRAKPPHMHVSSLAVQLWGECLKLVSVPRNLFWPAPAVDSEVIVLKPYQKPKYTREQRESIISFSKPFFQNRRKQLGTTFKKLSFIPKDSISHTLSTCSVTKEMRPQELFVEQWACCAHHFLP